MTIAWVTNWVCSSENNIHTVNDTVCIRLVFASIRCAHSNEVQITNLPFASTIFIISSFFGVVFLWSCCCYARNVCHTMSANFFSCAFRLFRDSVPKIYLSCRENELSLRGWHSSSRGWTEKGCLFLMNGSTSNRKMATGSNSQWCNGK